MKKKVFKALPLVVALSLLLSVFALTACTDKPRTLNEVEQRIVGKWQAIEVSSVFYTFNDDGTWTNTNNHHSEIKQEREVTDEHGHYYVISMGKNYLGFAWFENDPDNLYSLNTWEVSATRVKDGG